MQSKFKDIDDFAENFCGQTFLIDMLLFQKKFFTTLIIPSVYLFSSGGTNILVDSISQLIINLLEMK